MIDYLSELNDLFQDVFDDDELTIIHNTSSSDIEGWDSLMHINLIVAIEKNFGVEFAAAEIASLNQAGKNVGSLIQLLEQKAVSG